MPIYEYRCLGCGKRFELLLPVGAANLPPCPECGAEEVKRLFSLFSSRETVASGSGCGSCKSSNCATCQ